MNTFRADLHIHSVLSPCGDVEMSPSNIVQKAVIQGLDIIGITDHNSTKHCRLINELAIQQGIFVLMGAEVTTKEEVHCLTFFENIELLDQFQRYLEKHLPFMANNVDTFGYQLVVDKDDNVIEEIDTLLIAALDQTIEQIEQKTHSLGGLFIPAHIDRPSYSIISQLGFVPTDLQIDAVEISSKSDLAKAGKLMGNKYEKAMIRSSDAHYENQIGNTTTIFEMESCTFDEIRMALLRKDGRNTYFA